MLVILNGDASVSAILESPEDIENYYFDRSLMSIVDMPDFKNSADTEDYKDYFVIGGQWVHIDQVKLETLGYGKPPELK